MRLGLGIHSTELYLAGTAVLELPGGVLATDGRGLPRSPSIGALQLGTARDALRLHGCGGHCHGGRSAHLCSLASYKYYRVRVHTCSFSAKGCNAFGRRSGAWRRGAVVLWSQW